MPRIASKVMTRWNVLGLKTTSYGASYVRYCGNRAELVDYNLLGMIRVTPLTDVEKGRLFEALADERAQQEKRLALLQIQAEIDSLGRLSRRQWTSRRRSSRWNGIKKGMAALWRRVVPRT